MTIYNINADASDVYTDAFSECEQVFSWYEARAECSQDIMGTGWGFWVFRLTFGPVSVQH